MLRGIILAALLAVAGSAQAQSRLPGQWSFSEGTIATMMEIQFSVWADACAEMKMNCRDIAPPRVAYGVLDGKFGAFDLGSRTVLLDIRIFAQEVSVPIMFHEMVHYLQDKRSPLRGSPISFAESCADEKEAHILTYWYTVKRGYAKDDARVKRWEEIAPAYGCFP